MLLSQILWFVTLFVLSTIALPAVFSIRKQRNLRRPPGPLALPIIGHLHLLGPLLHHSLDKLSQRYGPLFHIRLGSVPCVVVSTPEMAKEFLKTNEVAFSSRRANPANEILSYGVPFAFGPSGPYWKLMKRLSTQELLGNSKLDVFRSSRIAEIHSFLHLLMRKAEEGTIVNLTEETLKLLNNIISRMMISLRCSETEGEAEKVRTVIREVAQIFGEFDGSDIIWFCKGFDLKGIKKRANDIKKRFDELLEKIISDREGERSLKRQPNEKILEKRNDFLDILLDAVEDNMSEMKLTRNHVKSLILEFFTAATDTSAVGLEWALSELINNPKVLKNAQEEINNVIGHDRLVQESDISHLPYIEAILKETFRLHPPVPMIPRKSVEDSTISGYHIQANTLLLVNIWSIGRNQKYWKNPLEFRPERFLEGKDSLLDVKGQNFELLTFGTGRRGCPGMPLALQSLSIVLALLIQCFEYEVPNLNCEETNCDLNMDEKNGMTVPRATDLKCLLKPRIDLFNLN